MSVSALQGYNLYLDAVLETTQQTTRLNIKTDEKFADFLLTETIPELRAQLDFTCSSSTTRTIRIQVTIREENLYAPTFKPEEYVIQLPLPLPKNFDLTQFVNEVSRLSENKDRLTKVNFNLSGERHNRLRLRFDR